MPTFANNKRALAVCTQLLPSYKVFGATFRGIIFSFYYFFRFVFAFSVFAFLRFAFSVFAFSRYRVFSFRFLIVIILFSCTCIIWITSSSIQKAHSPCGTKIFRTSNKRIYRRIRKRFSRC